MEKGLGQSIVIDNKGGGGGAIIDRLAPDSAEAIGSTPEEYAAYIAAEQKRWREVVRKAGIKAG
jgi:tripartite-type tricarboxylate transporter receptor subunit TctC